MFYNVKKIWKNIQILKIGGHFSGEIRQRNGNPRLIATTGGADKDAEKAGFTEFFALFREVVFQLDFIWVIVW